ncbi:hypothetical protein DEJ51_13150 [Streptomyces venezuelae]|uniref:Pyrrolo-quinoline quinone repeat domain-containing protein n=1 Tax=Streptomyces venezuelae TaxID=54571 RepID=A0A5P2DIR0_STRVZ|nr:PQQ-binding-like beta-propeller repeat protein [Streptomyces venezuelae]QES55034.1 hypothetical protein DEJ51_13150 [Streptomyces venezuelae]
MTELPQPPNQPPTPSGYGHLPGPPQQGYGFPPQGENPYAQSPGHPPQPPTVEQQAAGPGHPPPPGGGPGTPPRKKRAVLTAAALAAALVLGGIGYVAFSGDDEDAKPTAQQPADAKPSAYPSVDKGDGNGDAGPQQQDLNSGRKQGEDKVLWLKTTKVDGPGKGVDAVGQWVVGDTVVKSVWKNLTGYSVTDGKEKWTLPFPAEICAVAAQTTAEGRTAVMYRNGEGENTTCNQLRVADLKTGKEVWSKEVPEEGLFDIFVGPTLAITGDTVAVSRDGAASAFRISNGDKLFASPRGKGCNPDSYEAGNGKMIALATCSDAQAGAEVHGIDPVTGAKTWAFRLPDKAKVTSIYSVNPTVIDVGNEQEKKRGIIVLGPDGQRTATVLSESSFAIGCGDAGIIRTLSLCPSSVVDNNTLYLPTAADKGKANDIVAFDLGTGKEKWRVPAGDKRTLIPLKAENGQLIAYRKAEEEQGGEVLSIPAAGGTPTAILRHPSGPAAPIESTFYNPKLDYADGRFFISVRHLRIPDREEKLLMVFGK